MPETGGSPAARDGRSPAIESAPPDGLAGWAVDLMERLGGPGAGLAIFLESLFPPLPSEVILPLAGFAARLGDFSLVEAIAWTTIGSLLGAWLLYGLGAGLGHERLRRIAGRVPLLDPGDVDRSAAWFGRHGGKAVFFGRMIPMFRSFISIPAGIERMNILYFSVLTVAGSLLWNTAFVLAGYALGANWHRVEPYAAVFQYGVIAAVVLACGWFAVRRLRRRRAGPQAR